MQSAIVAVRMGAMRLDGLLSSSDGLELMVFSLIAARAFEQHVEFVEAQRKNLAAEINNALVKAFGG